MNLKSYTLRVHPSRILKGFYRRLRLKAVQKCDFILCFRQELCESEHVFAQNSVSVCSETQRNCNKTPKSCAIKQMVNAAPFNIELWIHAGDY